MSELRRERAALLRALPTDPRLLRIVTRLEQIAREDERRRLVEESEEAIEDQPPIHVGQSARGRAAAWIVDLLDDLDAEPVHRPSDLWPAARRAGYTRATLYRAWNDLRERGAIRPVPARPDQWMAAVLPPSSQS